MSLKAGCLPYAVGKQPPIPLINLGRKWMLNWRWWCAIKPSYYRSVRKKHWRTREPSIFKKIKKKTITNQRNYFLSLYIIKSIMNGTHWRTNVRRCRDISLCSAKKYLNNLTSLNETCDAIKNKISPMAGSNAVLSLTTRKPSFAASVRNETT